MGQDLQFRQLRSLPEMNEVEQLQETIWGYGRSAGSPFPYPARCLFEFSESGGHVGGAFIPKHGIIGFSAAWIGREAPHHRLYLHSQLVGVVDSYRNMGVGYGLKQLQRAYALSVGISTIKWTFDPLQLRNASLNLRKLRAEAKTFVPNYFGALGGKQNAGFATDRLWVTWDIERTNTTPVNLDITSLQTATILPDDLTARRCTLDLSLEDSHIVIYIPSNIPEIRTASPDLFQYWQLQLRSVLSHYLPQYSVTHAVSLGERFAYALTRQ
jgi:predicted GNAT superfamily acetyltransferase